MDLGISTTYQRRTSGSLGFDCHLSGYSELNEECKRSKSARMSGTFGFDCFVKSLCVWFVFCKVVMCRSVFCKVVTCRVCVL